MWTLLSTLLDILRDRFTGHRRLSLRGRELIIARPIAGADDGDDGGEGDGTQDEGEGSGDSDGQGDGQGEDDGGSDDTDESKLGEGGKRALQREREARKKAEREAREARNAHARALGIEEPEKLSRSELDRQIKEREDKKLSETERLRKRAEEADQKVSEATAKARRANLLLALNERGLTGAKAKAAAKLLDGLEYDEGDEPTNLDDRIKAAKAEYGDDIFKAATAAAGSADQGARDGAGKDKPKGLRGAVAAHVGADKKE